MATFTTGPGAGPRRIDVAGDTLEITPLGSGQEVGRSCVLMSFKGKTVMFDCGVHPGLTGMAQLPYFDRLQEANKKVDLALITHFHMDHSGAVPYFVNRTDFKGRSTGANKKVDLALITHFHMDHSGAVPYFVNRTDFKGRIFMTHPTKSICKMLWQDHSKINKINNEDLVYTFKDIERSCQRIEMIDLREQLEVDGMRVTCYAAGHVLGAAMFLVEIAGIRVLYTGDYSREEDRHLLPAEIPPMRIHVLIVESTYGTQSHEDRKIRETRFLAKVVSIVKNGGKVLLPSFALGRAQELLLMLEEHWQKMPDLQHIPIYYNSPMALKCSRIFETFTNLGRGAELGQNPWHMRYVKSIGTENREKTIEVVNTRSACVVLAAPGMLQNGFSRELFELWASGRENAVIMTGYSVDGTIAKDLEKQPDQLNMPDGRIVHVRCAIDNISFSAHSDYTQTSAFIREIKTNHVILSVAITFKPDLGVTIAGRLALAADSAGAASRQEAEPDVPENEGGRGPRDRDSFPLSPDNRRDLQAPDDFSPPPKRAKKKEKFEPVNTTVSGILVEDAHGQRSLISPHELSTFTKLEVCSFEQTQKFQFRNNLAVLAKAIEGIYQDVLLLEGDQDKEGMQMLVQNCVRIKLKNQILELAWKASPMADMVADSIVLVALEITRSPIAVQALTAQIMSAGAGGTSVERRLFQVWTSYLKQTYGDEVEVNDETREVRFVVDDSQVRVDFPNREVFVDPPKEHIKDDILQNLHRCEGALQPVPKF